MTVRGKLPGMRGCSDVLDVRPARARPSPTPSSTSRSPSPPSCSPSRSATGCSSASSAPTRSSTSTSPCRWRCRVFVPVYQPVAARVGQRTVITGSLMLPVRQRAAVLVGVHLPPGAAGWRPPSTSGSTATASSPRAGVDVRQRRVRHPPGAAPVRPHRQRRVARRDRRRPAGAVLVGPLGGTVNLLLRAGGADPARRPRRQRRRLQGPHGRPSGAAARAVARPRSPRPCAQIAAHAATCGCSRRWCSSSRS